MLMFMFLFNSLIQEFYTQRETLKKDSTCSLLERVFVTFNVKLNLSAGCKHTILLILVILVCLKKSIFTFNHMFSVSASSGGRGHNLLLLTLVEANGLL